MHQPYLGSVMANQQPAFPADGIRHNNNGAVAANRADKRKADALVSAGRLHDDGIRMNQPALFCVEYHIEGGAGFDRASHIQPFVFHQNLRPVGISHSLQPNHRRVADRLKHIIVNHTGNHSFRCPRCPIRLRQIRPFRHIFSIYHSISRRCAKCNKKQKKPPVITIRRWPEVCAVTVGMNCGRVAFPVPGVRQFR